MLLIPLLLAFTVYLAGSLSTAILLCRYLGLPDPRRLASGNPGATNMLRLRGRGMALLVLLGDMAKVMLPLIAAKWLGATERVLAWLSLAGVLGHVFPIFFGFQGGKGVATAFGALMIISPGVAYTAFGVWLAAFWLWRYASLAAMLGAASVPIGAAVLLPLQVYVPVVLIALIVLARHAPNLKRLLQGKEARAVARKF